MPCRSPYNSRPAGPILRADRLEGLIPSRVVTFVLLGSGTACLVAVILANDPPAG